ncbi:MAG: hypothetical protein RIM72_15035 [Alphaproteobacteria bacterium]
MKNLLFIGRVAWDDRLCRLAICWLAFLAVVSGGRLAAVSLTFSAFLGLAAAIAFAGGGKDGLTLQAEWLSAVWFGAVFFGLLFGVTLVLG